MKAVCTHCGDTFESVNDKSHECRDERIYYLERRVTQLATEHGRLLDVLIDNGIIEECRP